MNANNPQPLMRVMRLMGRRKNGMWWICDPDTGRIEEDKDLDAAMRRFELTLIRGGRS